MGDAKHTPGPWRIDYNQGDIWIGPHINGGPEVLTVVNMPTRAYAGPALQARIADARLIAAAPDLVEALRRVNHTLTIHGKVDADTDLHAFLRAALSKAGV